MESCLGCWAPAFWASDESSRSSSKATRVSDSRRIDAVSHAGIARIEGMHRNSEAKNFRPKFSLPSPQQTIAPPRSRLAPMDRPSPPLKGPFPREFPGPLSPSPAGFGFRCFIPAKSNREWRGASKALQNCVGPQCFSAMSEDQTPIPKPSSAKFLLQIHFAVLFFPRALGKVSTARLY